jgi:hypothetical protein
VPARATFIAAVVLPPWLEWASSIRLVRAIPKRVQWLEPVAALAAAPAV